MAEDGTHGRGRNYIAPLQVQADKKSAIVAGKSRRRTTIDARCEADEDVVLSALPVVNTANRQVIIRMSTLHKLTGSFRKLGWSR